MKKIKLITILVFLLFAVNIAAQSNLVSSFEKVSGTEDPTLKISFHSWGENRETQINLDQYFPIKRDPNNRYVYLAPAEISVTIDQNTGVATLKAFSQWTGTRDILFSLTDVYNIERATSSLQSYKELISKQRAPTRIKETFEDLPSYSLFEKVLDDLEAKSSPNQDIKVEKQGNNIKINVAKTINLDVDLDTLTEDSLPTLNPRISLSIQPDEIISEEEASSGLSFFIFIPLYIILATLAVLGGFYIRKNRDRFAKILKKEKSVEKDGVEKLRSVSKGLSSINSSLNKEKIEKSISDTFEEIKKFFNVVTTNSYEYSYSEIEENKLEKKLSPKLKKRLIEFSSEISDVRFKGETIETSEIKKIIDKTKRLIEDSLKEEESIEYYKEKEKIRRSLPIRAINYVLDSFASNKPKVEKRLLEIKKEISFAELWKGIFHKLGLLKTLAEKEFEKKRDYELKLKAIKDKELEAEERKKQKELEKERVKEEKRKEKLLKLKEKQREERLKLLEKQRVSAEKQRRKEEGIKKRKERIKRIKNYFHDRLGLFTTAEDLEKAYQEKRKIEAESLREIRRRKEQRKKSWLNLLHFLRLYKTPEEKQVEEEITKRETRLEKERENRKKDERKRKIRSILHYLKLYRTPEEVENEKRARLKKLRDEEKEKEEKYKKELEEEKAKQKEAYLIKQRKLAEKHRKQRLKEIEKQRKLEMKEKKDIDKRLF